VHSVKKNQKGIAKAAPGLEGAAFAILLETCKNKDFFLVDPNSLTRFTIKNGN